MKKTIATIAAVAALAATAASTQAMAGGKHHHHRHHFRHFSHSFVYIAPRHECGFERWKWKKTGAYYWKKRYLICKGWW